MGRKRLGPALRREPGGITIAQGGAEIVTATNEADEWGLWLLVVAVALCWLRQATDALRKLFYLHFSHDHTFALTFTRKVTLSDSNRSAGRACHVKIRIVPAYTWLCQFVQALLAISLAKISQKAQIIRYLLQKTGSDAFRNFFEWK